MSGHPHQQPHSSKSPGAKNLGPKNPGLQDDGLRNQAAGSAVGPRWAVRFQQAEVEADQAIGSLRLRPEVTVCEHRGCLWVQGPELDQELDQLLRSLPGVRFTVLEDGQLIRSGSSVPQGWLPEGPWKPLADWLGVRAPSAGLPGRSDRRIPLILRRGGPISQANVLLTTLENWHHYATKAPQVRLSQLSFALSEDQEVLVRGSPLPAIPGTRFVETEGVAIPAGWTWDPPVDVQVIQALLGLTSEHLALLKPDGSWERLPAEAFVYATRSAVRLSAASFWPGTSWPGTSWPGTSSRQLDSQELDSSNPDSPHPDSPHPDSPDQYAGPSEGSDDS